MGPFRSIRSFEAVLYARTAIKSERDQVKKLEIGYSDDVSVFLNGSILYRGRSAQGFRDPGFLGIVNPENDGRVPSAKRKAETNSCWPSVNWAEAGASLPVDRSAQLRLMLKRQIVKKHAFS